MKMKRYISLCLLAALLTSLAACGGEPAGQTDDTTTVGEDTTAPVVSEYTPPEVDYGGKTVTITGYSYSGNWAILRYNIGLEEENGDTINDAIVKRNRAVEQELNVNIEMIPLTSNDRSKSTVLEKYILAQEDVITYGMQMNCGLSKLLTTDGMLVDLQSIPTLDLAKSWWNQNANDEYTIYGKQLAAVGDACFFNLGAPVVMYFSKDLINQNQLDNPYQLVYDGKWTIDTMNKMAQSAARDINGNSEIDVNDIFGLASETSTLSYMIFTSGERYSKRETNGNIYPTLNTEKTINIVEKIVPLIRNKTATMYYEDWKAGYSNAHSDLFLPKLMENELLFYTNQLLVTLNLRAMESDFGIVPMPKYDEAQENYISIANTYFSDHIVVPSTNQDLELVGHLLDAMGYYGQQYITTAFIDESIISKGIRDEDSLNMINLIHDTQIFDVGLLFEWGGMSSILTMLVMGNSTEFASQWAGISEKVETELEATAKMLKGE